MLIKRKKEVIDLKNHADQVIYATEKMISENKDKIKEDELGPVNEALEALKKAKEGDNLEEIRSSMDNLQKSTHKISEQLYKAAQENKGDEADNKKDDDVVDGEVVDK